MFCGSCPTCFEATLPVDAWSWPCGHAAHKVSATTAPRAKPCIVCRAPPDPRDVHASPSSGDFAATPACRGRPPPAPPVIILCCPRVTHNGGVFTSEADDRRDRWAPSLSNDTCEGNWCCISCDTMYSFDETQRTYRLCLPRCSAHGERLLFIDTSACDERGQAFYVCAQPMPHDMAYPLLSCLRTIACHIDRDISGARINQQLAEVSMQRWMNDEYEPVLEQWEVWWTQKEE